MKTPSKNQSNTSQKSSSFEHSSSVVDPETGEVHERKGIIQFDSKTRQAITHTVEMQDGRIVVSFKQRIFKGFKDPYVYFFKKGMRDIAKNDKITGQDFRILFYIMSWVQKDNVSVVAQASIVEVLDIKQSNLANSLARLERERVLRRCYVIDQNGRRVRAVRINATAAWCGLAEDCDPRREEVFLRHIRQHRKKRERRRIVGDADNAGATKNESNPNDNSTQDKNQLEAKYEEDRIKNNIKLELFEKARSLNRYSKHDLIGLAHEEFQKEIPEKMRRKHILFRLMELYENRAEKQSYRRNGAL